MTEESRSEGKIGLKAYKNYFIAGAHWLTLILLILVNIVAQVLRDICFVLCPQLDIYSEFISILYLFILYYCILQFTGICIETYYLWGSEKVMPAGVECPLRGTPRGGKWDAF